MTTTANAGNTGTVTPGTAVTDTATVTGSGITNAPDPTGTVDFFLCTEAQLTANGCETGGTAVGTVTPPTPANRETLVGGADTTDGIATATSEAVNTATSPLAPGKYCFRAEYSGDDNYDPDTHTNTTTECFTVSQPTTISTTQSVLPQDSATVTPAGTAGTVVFSLYTNGTCSGDPVETFTDETAPYTTNNQTTQVVSATGAISWSATFDPSGNEESSTTTRCERTDLTIDNSASPFPPTP
jgi:hypothetical protein